VFAIRNKVTGLWVESTAGVDHWTGEWADSTWTGDKSDALYYPTEARAISVASENGIRDYQVEEVGSDARALRPA
jgi:hypothetical protein